MHCQEDHTAGNIVDDILSALEDWDLKVEQLVALTTDSASNMIKACKDGGK